MSTKIFLDECGYTGDDLLDVDQPVFSIATHSFTEEECTALTAKFFSHVKASELKHSSLQKRPVHQRAIIKFLEHAVASPGRIRIGVADKRYAMTAKLVDLVVEPPMHRDGLDLYAEGGLVAMANMLFAVLQAGGSSTLDGILSRFQRVVREPNPEHLDAFHSILEARTGVEVIDETVDMLRVIALRGHPSDLLELSKGALDLSFTVALSVMSAWRGAGHTDMHLVHDQSSNMARKRDLWEAIVSPDAPPARVGYGTSGIEFPLGVGATEFVNSRSSAALQVADVLAGATTRLVRWYGKGRPVGDNYARSLHALIDQIGPLVVWQMLPSDDVSRKAVDRSLGDPLEYLMSRVTSSP